jgi:hypothetical protein
MKELRSEYFQRMLTAILFRTFIYSLLQSKNVELNMYKTIILPVVLYGRAVNTGFSAENVQAKGHQDRLVIVILSAVIWTNNYHVSRRV